MKSRLEIARMLIERGFYLFPIKPNEKTPAHDGWQNEATRSNEQITKWFGQSSHNIGIYTGKFQDDKALVVVDIDVKRGKDGFKELQKLELLGSEFSKTFEQTTPSGGKHLVYVNNVAIKQGTNVLAEGLDIRSRGGFIVAVGSEIDGARYGAIDNPLTKCPEWIVQKCGLAREKDTSKAVTGIDIYAAIERAKQYLTTASHAVEGAGGDQTTFKIACSLKDFGLDEKTTFGVLVDHWNEFCSPPWAHEDLRAKVAHAYRYGNSPVGSAAPEAFFSPITPEQAAEVISPVEKMNEEYAFITTGGKHFILHEKKDEHGDVIIDFLGEAAFHKRHASKMMMVKGKFQPVTKVWMSDSRRRSYERFCFCPETPAPSNSYNLWKGFSVQMPEGAASEEALRSVQMFLEHSRENICQGNEEHHRWLIGYFAHLIQKPYEKPLVALVFKGKKGTGKNALVERVGRLINNHFFVTADRRYLISNFNSVLENNLMMVLDEAFWSGDKQAEGITKSLITGAKHKIERKGQEPYDVKNLTRVAIIGNEDWLVPATVDERRFAVFNVGDGRIRDKKFFREMREGMERGGYAVLLHHLQAFDLSRVDVDEAPNTQGLIDQKLASLEPIQQWWFSSILAGKITSSGFGSAWPETVDTEDLRNAFIRYSKEQNIRSRILSPADFGKELRRMAPKIAKAQRRDGEGKIPIYKMGSVEVLRKDWEKYMGHEVAWDSFDT